MVKASYGKIYTEKGFLKVKAKSQGYSLLLLPLEFSHCLILKDFNVGQKPILLQANLIQTAILFYGNLDANISYFTGPFYNSYCRLKDAENYK